MTSEIKPADALKAPLVTPEQVEIVRRTVFPGSSNDELAMYLHDCARQGVHPLDRLIHPTVRTDKRGNRRYTPITSIDLFRSRADATGEYAGNDEPVFVGEPMSKDYAATVTIWKIVSGVRCPFTATARWTEYVPESGSDWMWRRMPSAMIGKCAEALAFRKAFPRQLSGLYAKEEMEQSEPATVLPVDSEVKGHAPIKDGGTDDRRRLMARIVNMTKEGYPTDAAAKAVGVQGRRGIDYTVDEMRRMIDKAESLALAEQQDQRAEADAIGVDPLNPAPFDRKKALAFLGSPDRSMAVEGAMMDLGIPPTPLVKLSDGALEDISMRVAAR